MILSTAFFNSGKGKGVKNGFYIAKYNESGALNAAKKNTLNLGFLMIF